MIRLEFYLAGNKIKEPLNYQEAMMELSFDRDNPTFKNYLSTNNWIIGLGDSLDDNDGTEYLKEHIEGGLSLATDGLFGSPPFEIRLINDDDGTSRTLLNGYLDLSKGAFTCHQIEASSYDSKGLDWLNDNADSFTFYELFDRGVITKDDIALIPYAQVNLEDKFQTVLIISQMVNIAIQIFTFISVLIAFITAVISSGGWGWENIFAVISLAVQLILIFVNIKLFLDQVSDYLFTPVQYKSGMYLKHLCEIGANQLGYEFESSILDGTNPNYRFSNGLGFNNVVLMPESHSEDESDKGIFGALFPRLFTFRNVYKGTYGDLLRELKTMFNAKIIIQNEIGQTPKIILERRDTIVTSDPYVIPPVDRKEIPYKYNSDELYSKYSIAFLRDDLDNNVIQNYVGHEYDIFHVPVREAFNQVKGVERLEQINFGLSTIKTELTKQEKFVKGIVSIWYGFISTPMIIYRSIIRGINALIRGINKILSLLRLAGIFKKRVAIRPISTSNLDNPLQRFRDYYDNQRLGILALQSAYVKQNKLVALNTSAQDFKAENGIKNSQKGYKPHPDYRSLVNSKFLYEKFHYINNFIEDPDLDYNEHNQHLVYQLEGIPFCLEDYLKVKADNGVLDYNGIDRGEIISVKWNIYAQTADIVFKIKKRYTSNFGLVKVLVDE